MSISARVVADSVALNGKRITTFVLTYPRFVHAEFMTHRVFSRNAASSRAIPARKIRQGLREDPAMPVYWGANKAGMQAEEELTGRNLLLVKFLWKVGMYSMLALNWLMEKAGLHKQIANRILEPWFCITTVVTSTEWDNFYALRNHPQAQPEIRALAQAMLKAHNESFPKELGIDEWHLPFVHDWEGMLFTGTPWEIQEKLLKISVARCARVSYNNHEGKRSTFEEDEKLFQRLVGQVPKHASPLEHQATPLMFASARSGNFFGWRQYRGSIQDESIKAYPELLQPKP